MAMLFSNFESLKRAGQAGVSKSISDIFEHVALLSDNPHHRDGRV